MKCKNCSHEHWLHHLMTGKCDCMVGGHVKIIGDGVIKRQGASKCQCIGFSTSTVLPVPKQK